MFNFGYLYNLFNDMLEMGSILWNWINSSVNIGTADFPLTVPVWSIILTGSLTVGLGFKIVKAFLGN